jgi:hypothetical protein
LKSTYTIAKEIGVTPQAIRKRITPEFTRQFNEHIQEKNGLIYFDPEVEELLKLLFNKNYVKESADISLAASIWSKKRTEELPEASVTDLDSSTESETISDNIKKIDTEISLPALPWIPLPTVQPIQLPLCYPPDTLIQLVEIQRQELNEFLKQLDRLIDQLIPSDWLNCRFNQNLREVICQR